MNTNLRRYLLVILIFLLAPAANAVLGSAIDGARYRPLDYYTFVPPAVGGSYADPVFGSSIMRITNALSTSNIDRGGNLTFITGEYSTMSPFNQDGSKLLLVHQSYFALYDGDGNFVAALPFEINASSEPRWSRSDSSLLYYHAGNQLKQYNISTETMSVVHVFSEYSSINGMGESDISFDGDHFVFSGNQRYIFVYEISTNTQGAAFDTGGRRFDSLYITPNNNVTVSWIQSGTARYNGVELYDRNMNFVRQLTRAGGHMDVTRDTNGDEVIVWTNSADPAPICDNGIVKVRMADGQQTCLLSLDWSLAVHISGPDNSGWALVETYAPSDPDPNSNSWVPYTNEILQVRLDGSQVLRLAHHRSRPFNSYNYMPKVSVSRDGSKYVYNSDYGLQASLGYPTEYGDVYLAATPSDNSGITSNGGGTPIVGGVTVTGGVVTTTTTLTEQNGSGVGYSGTWFANNMAGHSGGGAVLAVDAGSRATFTFSGTTVRWIGYCDEWSGIANVYLDGAFQGSVNTYASPAQAQAVLYSAGNLAPGYHTLLIEATGTRSSSSAGSWVWIDAFVVDKATTAKRSPRRR